VSVVHLTYDLSTAKCSQKLVYNIIALLCFVVESYIYVLKDSSGFITSVPRVVTTDLYFLSSESSSVSANVELMCDDDINFNGHIKVTS